MERISVDAHHSMIYDALPLRPLINPIPKISPQKKKKQKTKQKNNVLLFSLGNFNSFKGRERFPNQSDSPSRCLKEKEHSKIIKIIKDRELVVVR